MTNTLFDISGKIDPSLLAAIRAVLETSARLGIPFMIIGAAARDFLLHHAAGLQTGRATMDVDFAVLVDNWDRYEEFASRLTSLGGFSRDRTQRHRFTAGHGVLLDLVPFGKIAGDDQVISWPPDASKMMSTVGFNDVFNSSLPVLLSKAPDLVVNVASLPGLSILKLISWQDAYPLRRRDAEDFFQILYSYMDAGNLDRLPTDAKDLVGDAPPPLEILGAELLGRDMREISGGTTAAIIGRLLEVETATDDRLQLLGDMVPAAGPTTSEDELFALLVALRKGFEERRRDVS